jgi:hypothetical protein
VPEPGKWLTLVELFGAVSVVRPTSTHSCPAITHAFQIRPRTYARNVSHLARPKCAKKFDFYSISKACGDPAGVSGHSTADIGQAGPAFLHDPLAPRGCCDVDGTRLSARGSVFGSASPAVRQIPR